MADARAALYLAGDTGRRHGTLFCCEADGPLHPEHKRMLMDMKREVLRLGGYAREFYVSQTPELNAIHAGGRRRTVGEQDWALRPLGK